MECPVTDEIIFDVDLCKACKLGLWYGCPVRQEVVDMEAYDSQEDLQ